MVLAALEDKHVELLGGSKQLKETLEAAARFEEFTSTELAELLKVKLPNLHQRLKALEEAGAVIKRRDETARRGTRYLWEALGRGSVADLDDGVIRAENVPA